MYQIERKGEHEKGYWTTDMQDLRTRLNDFRSAIEFSVGYGKLQ